MDQLDQLNGNWLILGGLLAWAIAYLILWRLGPDTMGYLVRLLLGLLPLAGATVFAAGAIEEVLNDRHWPQVAFFGGLSAGLLVFFWLVPKEKYDEVFEKKKGALGATSRIASLSRVGAVLRLIVAALVSIGTAAVLVWAGLQLLAGSPMSGGVTAGIMVVLYLLVTRVTADWNFLHRWHEELKEFVEADAS